MESLVVYISVFSIGSMLLAIGKNKKLKINFIGLLGLFLVILFAGGRYHVGTDINTYMSRFISFQNTPWLIVFRTNFELLYVTIAKISYSIGGRVLVLSIFASLIVIPTYITLVRFYPRCAIEVALLTFMFSFYSASFNVTKQYIATAIIFYFVQNVFNNKPIRFCIGVLLATMVHSTAILSILIWFMWDHEKNCPISLTKRLVVILGAIIAVFTYQYLIDFFASRFSMFAEYVSYSEFSDRGKNRDFWLGIMELIILYFFVRNLSQYDTRIQFFLDLYVIAILIGITGFSHPQVKRIAYYFAFPAKIVLFGYLPLSFTRDSGFFIKFCIWLYLIARFILVAYIFRQGDLIPYRFDLFSAW